MTSSHPLLDVGDLVMSCCFTHQQDKARHLCPRVTSLRGRSGELIEAENHDGPRSVHEFLIPALVAALGLYPANGPPLWFSPRAQPRL